MLRYCPGFIFGSYVQLDFISVHTETKRLRKCLFAHLNCVLGKRHEFTPQYWHFKIVRSFLHCLHRNIKLFNWNSVIIKPRSHRLGGFLLCLRFISFFLFCRWADPNFHSANCCHQMMSSSASYRPFLSSVHHIPPQEHFVKLAN